MKQKIINIKYIMPWAFAFCILFAVFTGCKKADQFYSALQELPQINNTPDYVYKTAYIIGDTMVISGHLLPKNNLKITIGGITAKITKIDSAQYNKGDKDNTLLWMDKLSLLITAEMEGKAREVKVTSGNYSVAGASIDIYSAGGRDSFTDSLKAVAIKTFSDNKNIFLYCVNGKGDVYYYAPSTKDLRHLKKDGTEEILYDLSKSIDNVNSVTVTTFLAGGVDPQGQNLYFSVSTNKGYRFLQLNLQNKTLSTLNQSTTLSAPYEGTIGSINIIITGIYPDSKGNIYLIIGLQNDGIARYNKENSQISYIYRKTPTYKGMPGIGFSITNNLLQELKFSPDEDLVYALETGGGLATLEVFDLSARVLLQSFSTNLAGARSAFDVISPFSGLKLDLGNLTSQPDLSFGYLPLPGRRLQTLIYQSNDGYIGPEKYGFPKWVVFDFNEQRSYSYAPGRFNQGNFIFQPTAALSPRLTAVDALLNYDEDGNLYMTANGKMDLVKTQTIK